MGHGVHFDGMVPLGHLLLAGQLSVDQQVTDFDKIALLSQLLNWITTMQKDAIVTIQIGN